MKIDKNSSIPVYIQLYNLLLSKIRQNEYKTDISIPSERQLADELSISRMTVRQAYRMLENEDLLYRIKGKGTFVSKPVFEQKNIMSFTQLVKDKGYTPVTKILLFEILSADDLLKSIFTPLGNTNFYHVKRLRLADKTPLALEEVFIPKVLCKQVVSTDFKGSLHELLYKKYDHKITRADTTITALLPDDITKDIFLMQEKIPLLSVNSINYDQNGSKIYYESSLYRSDEFKYSFSMNLG